MAPRLAQRFTIVAPDLRGYGDSGKPTSAPDHSPYSKRVMARRARHGMPCGHFLPEEAPADTAAALESFF